MKAQHMNTTSPQAAPVLDPVPPLFIVPAPQQEQKFDILASSKSGTRLHIRQSLLQISCLNDAE
jgi:hypothetical protein